jgi:hypothetical protein
VGGENPPRGYERDEFGFIQREDRQGRSLNKRDERGFIIRPDDPSKGYKRDANDFILPREQRRPFGQLPVVDRNTGAERPLGEVRAITEMTVVQVGLNAVSCKDDEQGDDLVLVAKPWHLRNSTRDGGTVGDVYVAGDKILVAQVRVRIDVDLIDGEIDDTSAGTYQAEWVDLNIGSAPVATRAVLKTNRTGSNMLDCAILDHDGTEGATIVVARAPDLRKDYYDGNTIGGVAYVHVDKDSRTADGATENVAPPYVADSSVLVVSHVPGGTGLVDSTNDSAKVVWQEVSTRFWEGEPALPFAHYKLGSDQSLTSGSGEATVLFLSTDVVENVGSGFEWVTGSKFKILAAAAGKLVRIETTLILDGGTTDPYFLGSIERGTGARAYSMIPGLITASGHRHPGVTPAIDPEQYLTFGTTFRAVLDTQHYVSAMQENDGGSALNLKEGSFVTLQVLGG